MQLQEVNFKQFVGGQILTQMGEGLHQREISECVPSGSVGVYIHTAWTARNAGSSERPSERWVADPLNPGYRVSLAMHHIEMREDGCLVLSGPLDSAVLMPKGYNSTGPEKLLDRARVESL